MPLDSWLRGILREELFTFSDREFLKKQGLFNPDYVFSFVNDYVMKGDGGAGTGANYSRIIWAFFMFQKWYEAYRKK